MLHRSARIGLVLACAGTAFLLGVAPAVAATAPPRTRCELRDPRLAGTSGLVDAPGGPEVVDAGAVYRLDARCRVVGQTPVPRPGVDVEDLARAADGTMWLADTGDDRRVRPQVAVLRIAPNGAESDQPLVYADGAHDAEALILPADGRPVIVTKDLGGHSGVYTTDVPLPRVATPPGHPMALRRVGELDVPPTRTRGGDPRAALGGGLVTGGALSADGGVAAVRTATDAWLYPVAGRTGSATSVVAALRGTPVQVPLPDEPRGEAIAFARDGSLLSAGASPAAGPRTAPRPGALRAVPGAVAAAAAPRSTGAAPVPEAASPAEASSTHLSAARGATSVAQWIAAAAVLVLGGGLLAAAALRERSRAR